MFVTASSAGEAKKIAQSLVSRKLVACVNLVPSITSIYEWEGKVEESDEVMMIIKVRYYDYSSINVSMSYTDEIRIGR